MKTHRRYITIVTFVALAKAGAVMAAPCAPAPAASDEFAASPTLAFPNFCDIPPKPLDVPTAQTFRTAVVRTRMMGAAVVSLSAPDTFTLSDTAGFVGGARQEATPPPPMTAPSEADTEAFVSKSKAKAMPPHRPR